MQDFPSELRYTKTHEWVREDEDGSFTVGVTAYAVEMLGELVFVDLPEAGRQVGVGEEVVVVESVKAASDVYAPLAGEIVEINSALSANPEKVNQAPYGEGWLFRIAPQNPDMFSKLQTALEYQALVGDA